MCAIFQQSLEKGPNVVANNGAEALVGNRLKRVQTAATGHVGDPGGAAASGIRTPLQK